MAIICISIVTSDKYRPPPYEVVEVVEREGKEEEEGVKEENVVPEEE